MSNGNTIDALIQAYIQSYLNWFDFGRENIKVQMAYRMAKMQKSSGESEINETQLFELQLKAENYDVEKDRLARLHDDWRYYASILVGIKLLEEGDPETNQQWLAEPLQRLKDPVIEAVSDQNKIKRLRDWSEEDHATIIDLGNIFRLPLTKMEDAAKESLKEAA